MGSGYKKTHHHLRDHNDLHHLSLYAYIIAFTFPLVVVLLQWYHIIHQLCMKSKLLLVHTIVNNAILGYTGPHKGAIVRRHKGGLIVLTKSGGYHACSTQADTRKIIAKSNCKSDCSLSE